MFQESIWTFERRSQLDLGWEPVRELIAEIHDGDRSVRADWPWEWWGLEPLNRKRHDWQTRYAAAFRIGSPERLGTSSGSATMAKQAGVKRSIRWRAASTACGGLCK